MDGHLMDRLAAWLGVLGAAILGRLVWHSVQVQRGNRRFWSAVLWLDMLIACGMGLIAHGLCVYAGLSGAVEAAVVAVVGYLGPHAIDVIFAKRFGKD